MIIYVLRNGVAGAINEREKMYFGEVEYFKISTLHGFKYSMADVLYVFVSYVYYLCLV